MPVTDNSDSLRTRNLTVDDSLALGDDTSIEFKEIAAPATPLSGSLLLYAKADGKLYTKNEAGTESDLTTGAPGGTDVAVADGGTGASTAADARTNLGLVIGTDVQAHDTDLDAVAGLSVNGLVARTGAGTAAARTLTAGSAKVSVTDGDGVAGNPTVDLGTVAASDLSNGTTGTGAVALADDPTFTTRINVPNIKHNASMTIDLDAVDDTTLTLLNTAIGSAHLDVEGNIIVGGTVDGVDVAAHNSSTTEHGATGAVVGTTNTQTLTNKTITDAGSSLSASRLTEGTVPGARLATKHKTLKAFLYIEDPTATDAFPIRSVPDNVTIVRVTHKTDVGTVDFNLEKRAEATPETAGTKVWTADKQAGATSTAETSFNSAAIPDNNWLYFVASVVASSPTKIWVTVEYTIDD